MIQSLLLGAYSLAATTTTLGQLTVTATPPAIQSSIPQGAQRVAVLTLHLRASCDTSVTVTRLTLRDSGFGAASDILRLYAMQDGRRLSRGIAPTRGDPVQLRISESSVSACSSGDITVFADFSSTAQAGGEHRFSLVAVDASLPVTIQTAAAPSAPVPLQVTPHQDQSTVTAEFRPLLQDVSYGARRIVSRIALSGIGTNDQQIVAIMFRNNGSASNSDLQNLYLETSKGERVSSVVPQMDGRSVRIPLNSFILRSHDTKLLQLRADVRARRSHTINFSIEEPSDVEAVQVRSR